MAISAGNVLRLWPAQPGRAEAPFSRESDVSTDDLAADVEFLAWRGVPQALLRSASRRAASNGTEAAQELFALGFDASLYWSLLADDLDLPLVSDMDDARPVWNAGPLTTDAVRFAACVLVRQGRYNALVLAPRGEEVALLRARLESMPALADRIRIASPETIRAFIVEHRHAALTHYAVNRLAHVLPRLSARREPVVGARGWKALLAAVVAIGLIAPLATLGAVGFACTLFFLNCSAWKLAAAFRHRRPLRVEALADDRLPTYSVLVPLYREAAVVPELVAHLGRLDYPRAKLEILLIVEADDMETRAAIAATAPPGFEAIVVPPGGPRTKPKALTYALSFARGDMVVVFDAEDRPELDQLRRAAAAFHERPDLGCVQARLAPDNEGSWFARMFTVEYAANFEVFLPALAEWAVPLPLGGTSNHFSRRVLEKAGAWDPFNVTEDADLGIRLARFGYPSATIVSRTYEEAPITFSQWLPQRRRWIKGWMQTVAICLGRGISPGLRLSFRERLAVHGILTAGVLGLLLYPASLSVIVIALAAAFHGHYPTSAFACALLALNLGNAAAVLVAGVVSATRGLAAAGVARLAWHVPFLPLYWALMSLAAWQALFQYYRRPTAWEKTAHGVARDRQPGGSRRYF